MKKLMVQLLIILMMTMPHKVFAVEEYEVRKFVEKISSDIIKVITTGETLQQKADQFEILFKEDSNPPAIARFIAGKYFRAASENVQNRYISVFSRYLTLFYADAMKIYSGQTLEVVSATEVGRKGWVVVTKVVDAQRPLRVNWQVKDSSSGLKVVDLQVEGISMLITWRTEFNEIIEDAGGNLEAAIVELEDRIAKFP